MTGKGVYFDYCATTPLHPVVREAMLPALGEGFGNPSSLHQLGQQARAWVEKARAQVAEGLNASPEEITFTSGATEAINLALIGGMRALPGQKKHLIISAVEHHAGLHTAEYLSGQGFEVTILPVDGEGLISLNSLQEAMRPDTGMISVMMVNNEVGSAQDVAGIGEIAKENGVLFHCDAVQAVNCFEIDVEKMQIDLLSLSGHKIYGPKGIGGLYVRPSVEVAPLLFGGAQEGKLRPGTENVSGIVGLGAAMALRNDDHALRYEHASRLRKLLVAGLREALPEVKINGPQEQVAPHIVSASFPGVDGELLLFHLSRKGIAVSMGSACTSKDIEPSHVLTAMGLPLEQIEGTIRISLGEPTTQEEIQTLILGLVDVIELSRIS